MATLMMGKAPSPRAWWDD